MPHLAHHLDTQILDFIGLIRACPTRSNFLGIRLIVTPEQSTSNAGSHICCLCLRALQACKRGSEPPLRILASGQQASSGHSRQQA